MRVVRLGGRGVHTQGAVPYARMCVPCPLNVILTACEKDLGRVFRDPDCGGGPPLGCASLEYPPDPPAEVTFPAAW
jgi:hypothetical protein